MKHRYIECQCESYEHVARLSYDPEDNDLYLTLNMNQYLPWYKRVLQAVKYVLGRPSKFGHYDVTLVKEEDLVELRSLLDHIDATRAHWDAVGTR